MSEEENPEIQPPPSTEAARNELEVLRSLETTMTEAATAIGELAMQELAEATARQFAIWRDAALLHGFSPEFAEWMPRTWAEATIFKRTQRIELESVAPHVVIEHIIGTYEEEDGPTDEGEFSA